MEAEELHFAVQDRDRELVGSLLKNGASPNSFDEISKTPLHYACELEDYSIISVLLENGADINAQNIETDNQHTALGYVADSASAELIKYLLDMGADPTLRGWMGLNAIDKAKQRTDAEKKEVLALLGQKGNKI
ncbi:MAG TPA: ankyrin repeat domain-containing protein [Kangiella sp.]